MILVLVTAAISNFFQCTVPDSVGGTWPERLEDGSWVTALGGMSGVVYGLLGYVWMKSIYDRSSGFTMPQSTLIIMLVWLFFCMVPDLTYNLFKFHVANWAHGVGLIVGLILGYAPELLKQRK